MCDKVTAMNADLTLTDEWQAAQEQARQHDALIERLAAVERDRVARTMPLRVARDMAAQIVRAPIAFEI